MIKKILNNILSKLKYKNISRENGELYLTRYYVFRKTRYWMPSIYIHCFHAGDHDQELHNHPWSRSLAFILSGSYLEERRYGNEVKKRIFSPGKFNYIKGTDFHRVDLLSNKVWTLFISGPKVKDWYFWNRHTGKTIQWEKFNSLRHRQITEEEN